MTPALPAEGDETESSTSPEEEFAAPKSVAEHVSSADQSAKTNTDSDQAPDNSGDNDDVPVQGRSDVYMSEAASAQHPTITEPTAIITASQVVSARLPVESYLNSDTSSAPLNFPIASASSSSLPHSRHHGPARTRELVSSSPAPAALRSPTPNSIRVDKEVARLEEAIKDASPVSLHRLLRQEWRSFLYTPFDEDHVSYILRACLKNSTSVVVERGMKEVLSKAEFRPIIINNALKHVSTDHLLSRLPKEILREIVDKALKQITAAQLINRVPKKVLDEVVAYHLQTAPAKDVVNWLAKGSRLGYSAEDIIDDDDESVSLSNSRRRSIGDVVMNEAPHQQAPHVPLSHDVVASFRDPLLDEQEKNAEIERQKLLIGRQHEKLQKLDHSRPRPAAADPHGSMTVENCSSCGFLAPTRGGYAYHTNNMVCRKQTPTNGWSGRCSNCGQTFTTKQGQTYHSMNKVCSSGTHDSDDSPPPSIPAHPTFSTASRVTSSQRAFAEVQPSQARSAPEKHIPRPPLHTPAPLPSTPQTTQNHRAPSSAVQAIQAIDPEARISPSQLSAAKKAEMDRQIEAEDNRYQNALAAIDPQLPQEDQEKRRNSLKNGNATKKSQIRKSFGVTLRMREKDKIASRTVASVSSLVPMGTSASDPSRTGSSKSRSYVPSHLSAPTSGFSPINTSAPRGNPTPPTANGYSRPTPSQQSQPQNRNTANSNSNSPRMTGFGVLRVQNARPPEGSQHSSQYIPSAQAQPLHRAKRQRTSSFGEKSKSPAVSNWVPPRSRAQIPHGLAQSGTGLSMTEVSSDNAASKYPRKVPVGAAQAKWEQLQPKNNRAEQNGESTTLGEPSATEEGISTTASPAAPAAGRAGSNSRQEPIEIDSSSENEVVEPIPTAGVDSVAVAASKRTEVANADKPLPSTEDAESEVSGASRPASFSGGRGGFMAKRGGHRSLNH